jgi:purine nucleosidase
MRDEANSSEPHPSSHVPQPFLTPLPILLDTDPGVDDALALLLVLSSPELELVAVTTVAGNVGLEATTRNALLLLELAGRPDVTVHAGESPPLEREPVTAADVHGIDGLGGITGLTEAEGRLRYAAAARPVDGSPAAESIPRYARQRPSEITLVALGPLTNIARAAENDPEGLHSLREIVVMGGAFRSPGNITPAAEFNIFADPEAAEKVVNLGVRLRFIPLDVTNQVLIRPDDLDQQSPGGRLRLLSDLLAHTFGFYTERLGYPGCHLHDPLAVTAVVRPDLFRFRPARIAVETAGLHTRGMTVADLRELRQPPGPNGSFAEAVDAMAAREWVLHRLFSDRAKNPPADTPLG